MPRIASQDAQRLLAGVPEEYVFRCCDGRSLRDMKELQEALGAITDETFGFHSNSERSDFSSWVRDIIRDEKLARDLAKSPNRTQAEKRVEERIAFLSSKIASDKP